MTFLPIVSRELRVAARRRTTYLARVGAGLVSLALAGCLLPVFASQMTTGQGRLLFSILSSLAFAFCLVAGARTTADCLSSEKREGTIGLLFLTDLRGYDVVLGKAVSCSLNAFYALLAIVPVLALALLLGGVTLKEIGDMALLLLNTLFFSTAAGVFASTVSRNDRRAMFAAGSVILVVAAGPYGLAGALSLTPAAGSLRSGPNAWLQWVDVFSVSPVFAFNIINSGPVGRLMQRAFYDSLLMTLALSCLLLAISCGIVPRVCRERPAGSARSRWLAWRNHWSYGAPAARRAFRSRLLDRNAFYWLAARDRIKASYVWFFVLSLAAIWAWCGWVLTQFVFDWDVSFGLLLVLFAFFKVWLASEVCARLVEDRANGGFELLLSSPLDLKDLARGQTMALWRQFGKPVVLLLIITGALLVSALGTSHDGLSAGEVQLLFITLMGVFIADLVTLKWVGTWHAITSTQISRAMLTACTRVLVLPTLAFLVLFGLYVLFVVAGHDEERIGWGGIAGLWLGISLANDLFFGLRARWRFLHHFRELASQRFAVSKPGLEPFLDAFRVVRRRLWPRPETSPGDRERALAWKRWAVTAPLILVAAVVVSFATWRHSVAQRVRAVIEATRRAGEPVTLPALHSWGPVIPDDENAGLLFQKASMRFWWFSMLPRNAPGPRKLDWPGPSAPLSLELSRTVADYIARNQQALALLHAGAKLPSSRFPVYWTASSPQLAQWQAIGPLRPAADLLRFEALLQAEQGNSTGAVEAIQTLFGLARAMSQEPSLAAQRFRLLFLNAAVHALERVLCRCRLNEPDSAQLRHELRDAIVHTGPALARAFAGERCLAIDEYRSPTPPNAGWMGPGPTGAQKLGLDLVSFAARFSGLRDLGLLRQLQALEDWKAKARDLADSTAELLIGRAPTVFEPGAHDRFAAANEFWRNMVIDQLEVLARLRTAQAALAIEQFRSVHFDQLPASLSQIPLENAGDLPRDPFAKGLLHYRPLDHGYLLYSVGRDGVDNQGADLLEPHHKPALGYDLAFRVQETRSAKPDAAK